MLSTLKFKFYFLFSLQISVFNQITLTPSASSLEISELKTKIGDDKIVEQMEVFLVNYNGHKKINGTLGFAVELKSIEADVLVKFEREPNKWATIVHKQFNACKFLNGDYKNNILFTRTLQALKRSPTFSQKCPIPAHHVYKAELMDIFLDYPNYLPNISFSGTLALSLKRHLIYQIDVMGFTHTKSNKIEDLTV